MVREGKWDQYNLIKHKPPHGCSGMAVSSPSLYTHSDMVLLIM